MRISDWSSDVCSSDLLHLRMPRHDRGERLAAFQADPVHMADAGDERRMMHHHQGRRVGLLLQRGIEPVEPFGAEQIGRASCRERVCQYVSISLVDVSLKKTLNKHTRLVADKKN